LWFFFRFKHFSARREKNQPKLKNQTKNKTQNRSYHEIFDALDAAGIEPSATLHHFTHPAWLDDWCGGFEGDAAPDEFARWAATCARLFGARVRYWATFNEPTCCVFLGWITGMHTPGKIVHCGLAGRVLRNMFRGHAAAYRAMKAVDPSLQVGLVHHHIRFEAQGPSWLLWPARYCCRWMDYWWGYDLVHKWLLTGELDWRAPMGAGEPLSWRDPDGKPPLDWFGVNYYSRAVSLLFGRLLSLLLRGGGGARFSWLFFFWRGFFSLSFAAVLWGARARASEEKQLATRRDDGRNTTHVNNARARAPSSRLQPPLPSPRNHQTPPKHTTPPKNRPTQKSPHPKITQPAKKIKHQQTTGRQLVPQAHVQAGRDHDRHVLPALRPGPVRGAHAGARAQGARVHHRDGLRRPLRQDQAADDRPVRARDAAGDAGRGGRAGVLLLGESELVFVFWGGGGQFSFFCSFLRASFAAARSVPFFFLLSPSNPRVVLTHCPKHTPQPQIQTLLDNFEWNAGYIMEFGLYAWRPGGARKSAAAVVDRVLKEGAKVLVKYYAELPDTVAGVLAVAKSMVFGEAGERGAAPAPAPAPAAAAANGPRAPADASPRLRQRAGAAVAAVA